MPNSGNTPSKYFSIHWIGPLILIHWLWLRYLNTLSRLFLTREPIPHPNTLTPRAEIAPEKGLLGNEKRICSIFGTPTPKFYLIACRDLHHSHQICSICYYCCAFWRFCPFIIILFILTEAMLLFRWCFWGQKIIIYCSDGRSQAFAQEEWRIAKLNERKWKIKSLFCHLRLSWLQHKDQGLSFF